MTRTFCRELSNTFPNVLRVNRGKLSLDGVAEKALNVNAEKVMIIGRWREKSGKLRFFTISEKGLDAVLPLVYVRNVKLRRDFGENTLKERRMKSVTIVSSHEASLDVKRLENALSEFFNIPILSFKESCDGKHGVAMQILEAPSGHIIITFKLIPEFVEVGPQIKVSHLVWELT
jgi:rRNA maturation protein Rpf1